MILSDLTRLLLLIAFISFPKLLCFAVEDPIFLLSLTIDLLALLILGTQVSKAPSIGTRGENLVFSKFLSFEVCLPNTSRRTASSEITPAPALGVILFSGLI